MDQREWDYGARLPREGRAAESWAPSTRPESPEKEPSWASITDTGSLEPSPEAVAWAQRADAWAQRPESEQGGQLQQSRWSEVAATGRPAFPADGVGWRTQTAEWRATEQTARWRQTTEWRSASGTHGWRSTTEAWQTGAGAEQFLPQADPQTRQQLAISGTAWPTPHGDDPAGPPVEGTHTDQPPSENGHGTGPWQRFTEASPPWQPSTEARPAWQQFTGPAAPWEQSAPEPAPTWRQQSGPVPWEPGQPERAAGPQTSGSATPWSPSTPGTPPTGQPSWQQLVDPPEGRTRGDNPPSERRPGWQSFAADPAGPTVNGAAAASFIDAEPASYGSAFDAGRHLVREDDRDRWRREAAAHDEGTRRGGRRRAPEPGSRTSGGTGWSTRSEADNWAGHADTGSIQMFDAAEGTSWGARAESPSWRTPADTGTPSWQQDPGTASRPRSGPAAIGWQRDDERDATGRADTETADSETPTRHRSGSVPPAWPDDGGDTRARGGRRRADGDTPGRGGDARGRRADPRPTTGSPAWRDDTGTPAWRDSTAQDTGTPAWRDSTARDTSAPGWRDSARTDTGTPAWRDSTPQDTGTRAWRDSAAQDTGTPAWRDSTRTNTSTPAWRDGIRQDTGTPAWRDDIRQDTGIPAWPDGTPGDTPSRQRSGPAAIGWRRDDTDDRDISDWRDDERQNPGRGRGHRDTPGRRQDDRDAPGWEDTGSVTGNRRRAAAPADPWAQSAADTGIIPLSGEPPATDTGSWRSTTGAIGRARPSNPNRRRDDAEAGPGDTSSRISRRRADGGDAPVDPAVWRREPGTRSDGANWPADDWRRELHDEPEPSVGDAVTEVRQRIDPGARSRDRDEADRGTASYREGHTGDWRRELAAESGKLGDGEARRFGTQDFVPFRPVGSAAVPAAPASAPTAPAEPRQELLVRNDTEAPPEELPEAQWPPRRPSGYQSPAPAYPGSASGAYERRPVSGGLATASGRPHDLLEPDEDEIEEDTGGPLAAVGYTVVWYGVPVVLFVLYMLVLNGSQQAHALGTLAEAAPQFGLSLVLSMVVAVGLRWASGSWKAVSVGLAAAVMGGGLATVLSSAITGNSLS